MSIRPARCLDPISRQEQHKNLYLIEIANQDGSSALCSRRLYHWPEALGFIAQFEGLSFPAAARVWRAKTMNRPAPESDSIADAIARRQLPIKDGLYLADGHAIALALYWEPKLALETGARFDARRLLREDPTWVCDLDLHQEIRLPAKMGFCLIGEALMVRMAAQPQLQMGAITAGVQSFRRAHPLRRHGDSAMFNRWPCHRHRHRHRYRLASTSDGEQTTMKHKPYPRHPFLTCCGSSSATAIRKPCSTPPWRGGVPCCSNTASTSRVWTATACIQAASAYAISAGCWTRRSKSTPATGWPWAMAWASLKG